MLANSATLRMLFNRRMVLGGTTVLLFTAMHGMQTRSSDENSVCPSVCESVCHTAHTRD